MSHKRFRRVSRLRRGYHRRQVDAFLNHVEVSLGGVFPPPTAAEVRQAGFELVHGGYDVHAVDEVLDALEERVLVAQGMTAGRRGKADPGSEAEFLKGELAAPYMRRFPRARGCGAATTWTTSTSSSTGWWPPLDAQDTAHGRGRPHRAVPAAPRRLPRGRRRRGHRPGGRAPPAGTPAGRRPAGAAGAAVGRLGRRGRPALAHRRPLGRGCPAWATTALPIAAASRTRRASGPTRPGTSSGGPSRRPSWTRPAPRSTAGSPTGS